jgi:hypothetical protein
MPPSLPEVFDFALAMFFPVKDISNRIPNSGDVDDFPGLFHLFDGWGKK